MAATLEKEPLTLEVSDVSGQKLVRARDVQQDSSVGELIRSVLAKMGLPDRSANGEPYSYQARLEREGRHLNRSERVGDALQPHDKITLQPNIDAGAQ